MPRLYGAFRPKLRLNRKGYLKLRAQEESGLQTVFGVEEPPQNVHCSSLSSSLRRLRGEQNALIPAIAGTLDNGFEYIP